MTMEAEAMEQHVTDVWTKVQEYLAVYGLKLLAAAEIFIIGK